MCVSKLATIGSENGLLPGRAKPLSEQMLKYFYSDHSSKLQWNFNRNLCISIQGIDLENVVWKMAAILSHPQCVNTSIDCWNENGVLGKCIPPAKWTNHVSLALTVHWNGRSSCHTPSWKKRIRFLRSQYQRCIPYIWTSFILGNKFNLTYSA